MDFGEEAAELVRWMMYLYLEMMGARITSSIMCFVLFRYPF